MAGVYSPRLYSGVYCVLRGVCYPRLPYAAAVYSPRHSDMERVGTRQPAHWGGGGRGPFGPATSADRGRAPVCKHQNKPPDLFSSVYL